MASEALAEMTKRAEAAEARAEKAETALADAQKTIRAYKRSSTKAEKEITILKAAQSPKARPIGEMKAPKDEAEKARRAAALEAAFADGPTEIVFSDGRKEIRELAPRIVTNDAWRVTPQGRVLNAVVDLEPGDCQRGTMELRGFALLNEAGDQVGYCALPDAITIGRNQHFQLPHNMIRF